jgi:hypothetical protein
MEYIKPESVDGVLCLFCTVNATLKKLSAKLAQPAGTIKRSVVLSHLFLSFSSFLMICAMCM